MKYIFLLAISLLAVSFAHADESAAPAPAWRAIVNEMIYPTPGPNYREFMVNDPQTFFSEVQIQIGYSALRVTNAFVVLKNNSEIPLWSFNHDYQPGMRASENFPTSQLRSVRMNLQNLVKAPSNVQIWVR
jgi:hypothetical protein